MEKDYSSISPSAKSLMLIRGMTSIPFAKEAAKLMPEGEPELFDVTGRDARFWGRVIHFESRYRSIDQLLEGPGIKNILELSSGYSFRGLDMASKAAIHYIDTDLPDVIALKQQFVETLQKEADPLKGKLELLSLNAVDEAAFDAVISRFEDGPIAIVNEGLLMYLNEEEKIKLCHSIHKILKQRGGCWITADIYIRAPWLDEEMNSTEKEKKFFAQHNIEENKFDSFDAARAFFEQQGLVLEKEAEVDYTKLAGVPKLMETAPPGMIERMRAAGKIQTTWRLRAA